MQLSYFLPNRSETEIKSSGLAILREYGLHESLGDLKKLEELAFCETAAGPTGAAGLVIAPQRASDEQPPELLGYYPDQQTWLDAWGDGTLWVGMATDQPPTPDDLRRRTPLHRGYKIPLADGQDWEVPVLRSPQRPSTLFQRVEFTRDGQVARVLSERYRQLWERAGSVHDQLFGEGSVLVQDLATFARDALSLNYRYGAAEQNTLGLLESEHLQLVAAAACDWPIVEKLQELDDPQKKTESTVESATTSAGSNGSHLTTDPAEAN